MKIGFFTDGYLPQLNGVATSVAAWAQALEEMGHEVYIIAPKYPGYKDKKKVIRLVSFKFRKTPEIRLATILPEKSLLDVSKVDFDIIHALSGGSISTLGLVVARLKKVPFVFTYFTRWNHYTHYLLKGKIIRPKMMERVSRIFCNRCDCLVAPMPAIKDELISYGVKKPIIVIPSGVDLNKFGKQQKGYLRKITGIKNGKILLYVGRLSKEKSVDFLLTAFKEILDKNKNTHLVLVGEGPDKAKLLQHAKKLSINKNVYFTGAINLEEVSKVYPDADVFVFSSQTEAQGMVILEALASGIPVVAIEDHVFKNVIKNNENGFQTPPNHKEFAEKVLYLLNNPGVREEFSKNALQTVQEFSLKTTAVSFEKLYERLIERKKKKEHAMVYKIYKRLLSDI